jgi:hypothetical protein
MDRRTFVSLALLILAACRTSAGEATGSQWIVVTAPAHRSAVETLGEHRKAQGMKVVLVQTTDVLTAEEIRAGNAGKLRDHVARLCREFPGTSHVLLVGAVAAGSLMDPERVVVPALPGTVSRMKGQPSDNGYGLPGEDLLATVAVGRMPARTEAEARAMVGKTLAYERDTRPGAWRRRLVVLAGAPEFNPIADALVERLAMSHLGRIDPSWHGRAIYHNPQSRFCLPDDLCRERALAYVREGQALTLYLGHSNEEGFFANDKVYMNRDDWAKVAIPRGAGVFTTFGCLGCRLSGRSGEGYGVLAIRNPGGPAAVLGSHDICFASMVMLASEAFTASFLGPRPPERLAASWLELKRGLSRGKIDGLTYRLLDAVDGDSKIPEAVQRREHQEMFVLLGDPALRLPVLPRDLSLTVAGPVAAGARVRIEGQAPLRLNGATVEVAVERPIDSDPHGSSTLPREPAEARAKAMVQRHDRANRFSVARGEGRIAGGRFAVELALPEELPWRRLTVRAHAATEREEGMGVEVVEVSAPAGR